MRRLILASTFSLGCAASTPATPTTPEPGVSERLASLEAEAERREQEVEELRSRLALAQAEAEELRAASPVPPRETVRIGGEPRSTDEDGSFFEDGEGDWEVPAETLPEPEDEPEPEARGSRPFLRLYGAPEAPAPASGPWSPPEGTVSAREASGAAWSRPQGIQLPDTPLRPIPAPRGMTPTAATPAVAPVPIPTATASAAPAPGRAPAPRADGAIEAYRDALGALRARRFGEAEAAFERFAASHPQHRLAPNARYWRAEALYIQRRYPAARAAFEAYLRAHPSGEKAPDALLKIGLCHQRMGDGTAARRAYERLRREHPQSVAARLASREDA